MGPIRPNKIRYKKLVKRFLNSPFFVFIFLQGSWVQIPPSLSPLPKHLLNFRLHFLFSLAQKCVISSIILILTVYGYLWIDENLKMETLIRNEMEKIFEAESQNNAFQAIRPDKAKFGYKAVILSLGLVALVATWMG